MLRRELVTEHEDANRPSSPPMEKEVVSFHHHRLVEYFTALHIDRKLGDVDWAAQLDDIWLREVLIMLVGVAEHPQRYVDELVAALPERVLVCAELGKKLRDLLAQIGVSVKAIGELRRLDAGGFYGLDGALADSGDRETACRRLEAAGLLIRDRPVWVSIPTPMSPEPDTDLVLEGIRRWLEARNRTVLDRVETIVECLRNSERLAGPPDARLVAVLRALVAGGNTLESVRAIQSASRLENVDLYSITEPALLRGTAWCRREAVTALVGYRPGQSGQVGELMFVVFLQFMKGELLRSLRRLVALLPVMPSLYRRIPGILGLSTLSLAAALSPLALYPIIERAGLPEPVEGAIGLSHGVALAALTVGGAALAWSLAWLLRCPVLRITTIVVACAVAAPTLATLWAGSLLGMSKKESEALSLGQRADALVNSIPEATATTAVVLALLVVPQVIEFAYVLLAATLGSIALWSRGVWRGPRVYPTVLPWREGRYADAQRTVAQMVGVAAAGFGGTSAVLVLSLGARTVYEAAPVLSTGVVVLLVALLGARAMAARGKREARRTFSRDSIEAGRPGVRWRALAIVTSLLALSALLYVGIAAGVPGAVWEFLKNLVNAILPSSRVLLVLAIGLVAAVLLVLALVLTRMLWDLRQLIRGMLFGWDRLTLTGDLTAWFDPALGLRSTEILVRVSAVVRTRTATSEQKRDALRSALSIARPGWLNTVIYQEMQKLERESSQDALSR